MLGHGYGHYAYAVHCREEALKTLGMTARDLEQFLITTSESAEEVLDLTSISK